MIRKLYHKILAAYYLKKVQRILAETERAAGCPDVLDGDRP